MPTTTYLEKLVHSHDEAIQFFGSELILLKESISQITNDRIAKTSTLLIKAGQTGAALIQLASQVEYFSDQSLMLARSFLETLTNFCYVNVCDDKEYRAFILHPLYKYYHKIGHELIDEINKIDCNNYLKYTENILKKKEKLKEIPVIQEALAIFSETKPNLKWTNKSINERIRSLKKWGKFLDPFFSFNKLLYYSDASEAIHGSLYGCIHQLGLIDIDTDKQIKEDLIQKLYRENSIMILYLGILLHESLTLISYSNDITKIWDYSYNNRGKALALLRYIIKIDPSI